MSELLVLLSVPLYKMRYVQAFLISSQILTIAVRIFIQEPGTEPVAINDGIPSAGATPTILKSLSVPFAEYYGAHNVRGSSPSARALNAFTYRSFSRCGYHGG